MRPIDGDELYSRIMSTPTDLYYPVKYGAMVKDMPTLDQTKHGHWIDCDPNGDDGLAYHCSICGGLVTSEYRYCPDCGAKMDF